MLHEKKKCSNIFIKLHHNVSILGFPSIFFILLMIIIRSDCVLELTTKNDGNVKKVWNDSSIMLFHLVKKKKVVKVLLVFPWKEFSSFAK